MGRETSVRYYQKNKMSMNKSTFQTQLVIILILVIFVLVLVGFTTISNKHLFNALTLAFACFFTYISCIQFNELRVLENKKYESDLLSYFDKDYKLPKNIEKLKPLFWIKSDLGFIGINFFINFISIAFLPIAILGVFSIIVSIFLYDIQMLGVTKTITSSIIDSEMGHLAGAKMKLYEGVKNIFFMLDNKESRLSNKDVFAITCLCLVIGIKISRSWLYKNAEEVKLAIQLFNKNNNIKI